MVILKQNIFRSSHQDYFENICSFLPGAPFSGFFQEGLCVHRTEILYTILAIEQVPIFQKQHFSYRTDTNFPGALFSYRTDADIPGTPF